MAFGSIGGHMDLSVIEKQNIFYGWAGVKVGTGG